MLTEIHINEFAFKDDTLKLTTPKIISLTQLGRSNIISIGKIKSNEFAIQFETLISMLGQSERLVVGKIFYKRNGNEWEKVSEPQYYQQPYNVSQGGKSNNEYSLGHAAGAYGDEFYIAYLERYTLIK